MSLKCILQGQTAQPSDVLPKSPGVAAIGDSTLYARADHVHPHDDTKLDESGGTMTGPLILKDNPAEDLEAATKQYVDNHTSDVVLYTVQTLTYEQKAQARGNIGAAPGGFGGFGEAFVNLTASDITSEEQQNAQIDELYNRLQSNSSMQILVSPFINGGSFGTGFGVGRLYQRDSSYGGLDVAIYGYRFLHKAKTAGVWQPWEWDNPPMQTGVEYRTTERFWERPVYYKIVDCGQIADNKQVEHGIANMRDCISFQGLRGSLPMPSISNNNLSDPWSYYVADVSRTKITLACGTSAAGGNCHVMLKYTKTTD